MLTKLTNASNLIILSLILLSGSIQGCTKASSETNSDSAESASALEKASFTANETATSIASKHLDEDQATLTTTEQRPRIFSAMNLNLGPNFEQRIPVTTPLLEDIRFIFGWFTGLHRNRTEISASQIKANLEKFEPSIPVSPGALTMINIEHIPVENVRRHKGVSDLELQVGHDQLALVADLVRERFPGSSVGYFDMLPPQHMHAWDPSDPQYDSYIETLRRAEYRLDPITRNRDESQGFLDHVDYLAPAFYLSERRLKRLRQDQAAGKPFERNVGAIMIKNWIKETIEAARTTGKPVYAVLWHRETGNGKGLYDEDGFCIQPYIGDETFAMMIETTLNYCDGVILWSRHERYTPEAPWFAVIESFTQGNAKD